MSNIFVSSNISLSNASVGKNNNLDIIRFVAASLVIFSHSFPLSKGEASADFLYNFTNRQIGFGAFAVSIFFLYGGFLIAGSISRSKTTKSYFLSRIFRILPALFFVTFILTFIVGPAITNIDVLSYFKSSGTYKYLLNSLFIIQHDLPGVFTGNIYGTTVNGPLWTLPVEFFCYILCFFIYRIGFFSKKWFKFLMPLCIIGYILILFWGNLSEFLIGVIRPILLFCIGMAIYLYKDKIILNKFVSLITFVLFVFVSYCGFVNIGIILFFPYFMFTIAYATSHKLSNFAKHGEFSYGIYLWGWPIQQIIIMLNGGSMNPYINTIIALPIACVMGIISFYCIERPAQSLKSNILCKQKVV